MVLVSIKNKRAGNSIPLLAQIKRITTVCKKILSHSANLYVPVLAMQYQDLAHKKTAMFFHWGKVPRGLGKYYHTRLDYARKNLTGYR